MRNCVSLVESFASSIQTSQITAGTIYLLSDRISFHLTRLIGLSILPDDGLTKGRKRKAVDHDEETDPKKRKRKPRDPNAPKRPPSSYILFQNDIRKQLKEKHPNVPNNELLAMISKQWNEMTDQDKKASRIASESPTLLLTLFSIITKPWRTRRNNTRKTRKHTTLVPQKKLQPQMQSQPAPKP